MSLADKLTAIAQNEEKVYDAGRQAEQEQFWEDFQSSGNRRNYNHAFYAVSSSLGKTTSWTDNNFNPKYPIICTEGYSAEYMLAGSNVTRIDVPVKILVGSCARAFFNNPLLHTINSLEVAENVTFSGWFDGHTALTNITIEGVIAQNISFVQCPLSTESMKSIINHLENLFYAEEGNVGKRTVKFSDACWVALENEGTATEQTGFETWRDYVESYLGWLT